MQEITKCLLAMYGEFTSCFMILIKKKKKTLIDMYDTLKYKVIGAHRNQSQ